MVESVMVIIPLMIAFLSVLQLSTGVMARTVSSNVVQGAVAANAITSSPSAITSSPNSISATSMKRFELPGGGTFSIGSEQIHRPAVSPLLPGGDNYEATGMAITE